MYILCMCWWEFVTTVIIYRLTRHRRVLFIRHRRSHEHSFHWQIAGRPNLLSITRVYNDSNSPIGLSNIHCVQKKTPTYIFLHKSQKK